MPVILVEGNPNGTGVVIHAESVMIDMISHFTSKGMSIDHEQSCVHNYVRFVVDAPAVTVLNRLQELEFSIVTSAVIKGNVLWTLSN